MRKNTENPSEIMHESKSIKVFLLITKFSTANIGSGNLCVTVGQQASIWTDVDRDPMLRHYAKLRRYNCYSRMDK